MSSSSSEDRKRKHGFVQEEPKEAGLKLLFAASLLQQRPDDAVGEPTDKDVLCGRGGLINQHKGNVVYRRIVEYNKTVYKQVPKRHRILVPQSIVQTICRDGGRFLQPADENGTTVWTEVPFARATQKTSQALRERSREEKDEDSGVRTDRSNDDGEEGTDTLSTDAAPGSGIQV